MPHLHTNELDHVTTSFKSEPRCYKLVSFMSVPGKWVKILTLTLQDLGGKACVD